MGGGESTCVVCEGVWGGGVCKGILVARLLLF